MKLKRINLIKLINDFYARKRSLPYPSTTYVQEMDKMFFQKYGGRKYNVGDIMLYDKVQGTKIPVYYTNYNTTDYPTDRYTPMGVVVIPQDFIGQARMISLVDMSCSTPDTGTKNYEYIRWGGYKYDGSSFTYHDIAGLVNQSPYPQVCVDANGVENSKSSAYPYLPSTKFTNANGADVTTGWYNSDNSNAPSPYTTEWESNPLYGKGTHSSGKSVLADVDGSANTQVLLAEETMQPNWATDEVIEHQYDNYNDVLDYTNHFPPALCCARYHTEGTNAGDWYLPAIGELGYLMPRWGIIQAALKAAGQFAAPLGEYNRYWSSSEYSQYYAYYLHTDYGNVNDISKSINGYVRAFAVLPRI